MKLPLILPRGKVVHSDISSYYADVRRMIEYLRINRFCGCICFKSYQGGANVYVYEEMVTSAEYRDRQVALKGAEALETLYEKSRSAEFMISTIEIREEEIDYWSNLCSAEEEFPDADETANLTAMVDKLRKDDFTGFVFLRIGNKGEGGFLFLRQGELIASSYFQKPEEQKHYSEALRVLVGKYRESGGVTGVFRSELSRLSHITEEGSEPSGTIPVLEELLSVFEGVYNQDKRRNEPFDTLLRKKFQQKADVYDFLDPFLDDFRYSNGKIYLGGEIDESQLCRGITEAIMELAGETGNQDAFSAPLKSWAIKNRVLLKKMGVFRLVVPEEKNS